VLGETIAWKLTPEGPGVINVVEAIWLVLDTAGIRGYY
jgi:hypothetical protein